MNERIDTDRILPFIIKLLVWLGLFGILFLLRSFFLLIFLTFVFAYVQSRAVNALKPKIKSRTVRVVLVGVVFLSIVSGILSYLVPHVKEQTKTLVGSFPQYLKQLDQELGKLAISYPVLGEFVPTQDSVDVWDIKKSPSAKAIENLVGFASDEEGPREKIQAKEVIERLKSVTERGVAIGSSFLLGILFSFLIVLDLPRLSERIAMLKKSRVKFIYDEVADSIKEFGLTLGSALEAQLYIAIVNTILTAIGVYLLGIDSTLAFISMIVFFCSFIPVAGVFISSVPICILALERGGPSLVLGAILLIWVIHIVEAYILNPRIYGHALRINPVLVLIVLTIAGKLFGVWGLVLGLPVCRYVFGHAIWSRNERA